MKYYTPELEEFHIGFEYEFLEQHGSPEEKWVEKILTEISDGEDDMYLGNTLHAIEKYERVYLRNAVRVKYLDEDDIKELGWELSWSEFNTLTFTKSKSVITWWVESTHLRINYQTGWQLFDGQIKNKSELKRLMKQLGI